MTEAFYCNRCHSFETAIDGRAATTINSSYYIIGHENPLHLCYDCTQDLKTWIKEKPQK